MPRAKRAKAYRKLMRAYEQTFGFRTPYQCIVDAALIADACRFKMDLQKGLEQTLSGPVKPMITTCSMRHLYGRKGDAGVVDAIELGKSFERKRCGHLPTEYPEPLDEVRCLSSCVDPKGSGTNRFNYVIAANEQLTRAAMRLVLGVPLIYISRSVMIMEPMADASAQTRVRAEKAKLWSGIKRPTTVKRKREEDEGEVEDEDAKRPRTAEETKKKKKRAQGPKGPNPLSVKKPKKDKGVRPPGTLAAVSSSSSSTKKSLPDAEAAAAAGATAEGSRKKRKRKPKSSRLGDEAVAQGESGKHTTMVSEAS